eukprot:8266-Heterococcus_DN1.PRE.1
MERPFLRATVAPQQTSILQHRHTLEHFTTISNGSKQIMYNHRHQHTTQNQQSSSMFVCMYTQ